MTKSIRKEFWEAFEKSPFVMVKLEEGNAHALPMTAQLDKDADSEFWFYTTHDNRLAEGGRAMAQFVSKGHDLYACIAGTLVAETDPAVIDRYWSKQAEAWYEGGRNDPNLLMLRFDLDDAEIWTSDLGLTGLFKLMTGKTIDPQEAGRHADIKM